MPFSKSRLDYGMFVSEKYKYAYMEVPKAACTTMKVLLSKIEGYPIPEPASRIHLRAQNAFPLFSTFSEKVREEILFSQEWTRLAIVRNPYSRLISAYKSKIVKSNSNFDWHRESIRRIGCSNESQSIKQEPKFIPTFSQFVRYACAQENAARNPHWKSQTLLLKPDDIKYSILGKLENLDVELQEFYKKISVTPPEGSNTTHNRSSPKSVSPIFDENLAELVWITYREDFDNFGYSADSWGDLR